MDVHDNAFGDKPTTLKKRVLFIVTQSELGGAQQFIIQLIGQMEKDAYAIDVAVGINGNGSFTRALVNLGIPVFTLSALKRNFSPISDIQAIGQIKKLIHKLRPDTLFLLSSKAGFIGSLAAKYCRPRPKVIYRIGGWTFNDPWPAWKKMLWRMLEKISAPWKDIIIVNNTPDLIQAKEMGIKPRQGIILIHNGLDPYKIDFLPRDKARTQLGLNKSARGGPASGGKIIGTVANFYPAKGLEYLIEAAEKITREDVVWCIVGDGLGRPVIEKLIKNKGLTEKIVLIGQKERIVRYLNAFDLFVLPSVKEGFPWAVLEAMAAKLPVIATRVGAIPEIIEDDVSGYIVEPRNSEQIAKRVITLLDNDSRAREMGIQAHQRVLFAFNIDATIRQIEKLL